MRLGEARNGWLCLEGIARRWTQIGWRWLFARLRPDAGREPDDAVFGPTSDGGYYLLVLWRPEPALFCSIPWSTPTTLSASKRAALKAGLKTSDLPCENDVDDYD
jgi:hypothetical protein